MSAVSRKYGDAAIVAKLRELVREGKSDAWIGLQVRLLLEQRAQELRELGVLELPDDAGTPWLDTGTEPRHEQGTAWERHDDPEADR
ncbi:hypothetical protein [Kribbella sp. NPDC051137]|uniref:hypothetical protein n=1 Tax=Kribbella sp. NPDC051137 TaxID=3155045 RepID=UPI0034151E9D